MNNVETSGKINIRKKNNKKLRRKCNMKNAVSLEAVYTHR